MFNEQGDQFEPILQEVFDTDVVPQKRYDFLERIDVVQDMEINSLVDVIGVITSCPDYVSIISRRDNKELLKRSILVIDPSCRPVEFTLWGESAVNFPGAVGMVVAIKNGRVGEFQNQKNLVSVSSTQVDLDPPMEMTEQLQQWYRENADNLPTLGERGGRGDSSSSYPIGTFQEITQLVEQNAQNGDKKPVMRKVKATCNWIKHDERAALYYKSGPKGNVSKVVENTTANNGKPWYCPKTGEYFDTYEPRLVLTMIMSDHSCGEFVNVFDESCKVLLAPDDGRSIEGYKENGQEAALNFAFDRPIDTRRWVNIKAAEESYNEESRVKLNVMSVEEIDHQAESARLLNEIKRLM